MLKIANSVEYSIIALRYISQNQNNGCISTKEIADKENIPYDLLAKLMQKLVKQDIIISKQGKMGGYILKVTPDELTLNDIILAVEQKIQLTDCMVETPGVQDCARFENCCLKSPLGKMQDKVIELFRNTTLHEIIN